MAILRFIILSVLAINFAQADDSCLEKRYAFDIGSGAIKSTGNIVDVCSGKIIKKLGEHNVHLKYENCMEEGEEGIYIDKSCFEPTRKAIAEIEKYYGISCQTAKCAGAATEWARKAKNSKQILDIFKSNKIYVKLLNQQQEGGLGFFTANTHHKGAITPDDKQVVLDVGGGSFQLAVMGEDAKVYVFQGRYGVESFHKEIRRKYVTDRHHLVKAEIEKIIADYSADFSKLIKQNPYITKRLQQKDLSVFGIGRPLAVGIREQINITDEVVTKQLLMNEALDMSDLSFEQLHKKYPLLADHYVEYIQSSLILILSIMKATHIENIHILDSKATDYIALDPEFWW